MPIEEIVTANFAPLVGLVILLCFVVRNTLFNRRQTFLFSVTILVNIVMIVAVSLDYAFSESPAPNIHVFRRITSFLNYALSPLIPYLLILIVRNKRTNPLYALPFAVNVALCFVSVFVENLVFYITPINTYSRGAVYFFPFLVTLIYLALLLLNLSLSRAKSRAGERIFLIVSFLILFGATFMEIQYGYRFLTWTSTGVILVLYYLFLNIKNLMTDALTGALNRQTYQRELENLNHRETCFLALIDLNDFKAVNDLYGHDEGDRKLIRFVGLLHKNLAGAAKVYRIGGDEFVLISKRASSDPLLKGIEATRLGAEQSGLVFACGVAEYRPADDVYEVMRQVDNIMYANKTQLKSAKGPEVK